MGKLVKNKYGELVELAPCKCRVCGQTDIEYEFDVCRVCGWEDDDLQVLDPDYSGGANQMSLNQYKKFEKTYSKIILMTCFMLLKKQASIIRNILNK